LRNESYFENNSHTEDSGRLNLLMLAEYFKKENHDVFAHVMNTIYSWISKKSFILRHSHLVCCLYKMQIVILQKGKIKL
jgi:NADH:ubiquinone oxidoreductase subunit B-like Fe-S oxidoreductase